MTEPPFAHGICSVRGSENRHILKLPIAVKVAGCRHPRFCPTIQKKIECRPSRQAMEGLALTAGIIQLSLQKIGQISAPKASIGRSH